MHRRRVMDQPIIFVGLDVHKDTITVALAEEGRRGDVREYGRITNTPADLKKLLDKLGCTGRTLRFCYEAGPCGYGIQRQLTTAGHECIVVAPSLIPRKPRDRLQTDRRDANNPAKRMRDLLRQLQARSRSVLQARKQLSGFLLVHGHHYRALAEPNGSAVVL